MKTDALTWVIRFAKGMRDGQSSMGISEEATVELKALEESHAEMARALMAIRSRVSEAGKALPRERDADQMAAMEDSYVTISTEMLRDAFAALRKAGVI